MNNPNPNLDEVSYVEPDALYDETEIFTDKEYFLV